MQSLLIILLSSLLWRVRGGLKINDKKLPLNKVWYAVFFAIYGCLYFGWGVELFLIGFVASYASYQLYGWGAYLGALLMGSTPHEECELIDDLLVKLEPKPKLWGFCGTCLTGLIITFLWGLFLNNIAVMLSGLAMGVCYWLGGKINNEGKNGWNWGEWIFGAYEGAVLAWVL